MAVSLTLRRTAEIIAAKGGMIADITIGDVLELMDREAEHFTCPTRDHKVFYRMLREMGIFGGGTPEGCGPSAPQASSRRRSSSTDTSCSASRSGT